jgi:hypothetical protein
VIRRLFSRKPKRVPFQQGWRVYTTRTCTAGFFAKGWKGTVIAEDADGFYLVHFDGGVPRWVEPTEIARIPERRASLFEGLALAWFRAGNAAQRRRYTIAWILVGALACYAVPHRIAEIRAGDHPQAKFRVDTPSASSAVRS